MPLDQIEAERSARVNSDPLVAQLSVAIVQMKRDLLVAQQSMMEGNPALSQRRAILKTFEQTLEDRRKELEAEFDERLDELVAADARRQLSAAQSRHLYVKAHQDALGQILAEQDRTTREIGLTNLDIQNTQFQLQLDEEMHGAISRRIKTI